MNQININIPKGYEIDKEKSNLEKGEIVFKEVPKYPKTWEELGTISGYYTSSMSHISDVANLTPDDHNKNTWPSKEYAEASIALAQLLQLRERYIGDWKPNWEDDDDSKYVILVLKNEIDTDYEYDNHRVLSFPDTESRDAFLLNHRSLIEIAKPLL